MDFLASLEEDIATEDTEERKKLLASPEGRRRKKPEILLFPFFRVLRGNIFKVH